MGSATAYLSPLTTLQPPVLERQSLSCLGAFALAVNCLRCFCCNPLSWFISLTTPASFAALPGQKQYHIIVYSLH